MTPNEPKSKVELSTKHESDRVIAFIRRMEKRSVVLFLFTMMLIDIAFVLFFVSTKVWSIVAGNSHMS